MSDFTSLTLELNGNTTASPTWYNVLGANREVRFTDQSANQSSVASASWPFMTRPAATAGVDYVYAFTADTTGNGVYGAGAGAAAAAFAVSQYLQARWNWDALGTFASAPIMTAYTSTAHAAITRGDGSILGGHATDTGGTARSYLKGDMYGIGATTQVPAGNHAAPVVTDGATGSLSPATGAWLTNWQGLMGDLDYITYGSTPTATTAQVLYAGLRLFTGPSETPGTYTPVVSMRYTYT